MKDIGSASVTGSADCLPILQKMVDNVSRAKQALPSEFTSAAPEALRGHLVDFGRKIQADSKGGSDLMPVWELYRSAIDFFPDCDAFAVVGWGVAGKLETEDIQSRVGALQHTMTVFGTSFQGAGATREAASDSVSAAGVKITEGAKDQTEKVVGHAIQVLFACMEKTLQDECVGQFFILWSVASEARRCCASVPRARSVYHDVADQGSAAWRGTGDLTICCRRRRAGAGFLV